MNYKTYLKYRKLKKLNFFIVSVLFFVTSSTYAQKEQIISVHIGDPAPSLQIKDWIKGTPITEFKKDRIFVIEFWATWCAPCRAAMPHLSALANKYRANVTFLGIDILENATMQKIKSFVDSMGRQMDYDVAIEQANLMKAGWMNATGRQGIPSTFVINKEGKLAWFGHPMYLETVLEKIVNDTWDINQELTKRNSDRYLQRLADSLKYDLVIYEENHFKEDYRGKPELELQVIEEMVKREPRLKFAPPIARNTFLALLKTNQFKAYEYAKVFLVTTTYEEPDYGTIYGPIEYSTRMKFSPELYRLAAESHQTEIDKFPYPQLLNFSSRYSNIAKSYWHANDKIKAVEYQQKAIDALKNKKDTTTSEIETFKTQLRKYKNM